MTTSSAPQRSYEILVREERVIQAASIAPDEVPSCMTLFDRWASCFALGPQLTHIYRYGHPHDCKRKLEDFKFCLSMKALDQQGRRDAWIQRRAELSAAQRAKLQTSSEGVWEMRRDPLINLTHADQAFPVSSASEKAAV